MRCDKSSSSFGIRPMWRTHFSKEASSKLEGVAYSNTRCSPGNMGSARVAVKPEVLSDGKKERCDLCDFLWFSFSRSSSRGGRTSSVYSRISRPDRHSVHQSYLVSDCGRSSPSERHMPVAKQKQDIPLALARVTPHGRTPIHSQPPRRSRGGVCRQISEHPPMLRRSSSAFALML